MNKMLIGLLILTNFTLFGAEPDCLENSIQTVEKREYFDDFLEDDEATGVIGYFSLGLGLFLSPVAGIPVVGFAAVIGGTKLATRKLKRSLRLILSLQDRVEDFGRISRLREEFISSKMEDILTKFLEKAQAKNSYLTRNEILDRLEVLAGSPELCSEKGKIVAYRKILKAVAQQQ